jgi:succinate dehydrogenase / fumarate reductase flavoprotein subunit
MEYIQYHPTGAVWPPQTLGWLVTEALRGNGAHLVNAHGQRFVNELETRDTVSAANIRECGERGNGVRTPDGHVGVWLDTPMIDLLGGEGTFHRLFAGIERRFKSYGIDPLVEPLLVGPTQHYQNGGLVHDVHGRTNVPNLYAAGEVGGGVQGHNRLGGNSLADILVFGSRAGRHAAATAVRTEPGELSLNHVWKHQHALCAAGIECQRMSPILLPDYSRPMAILHQTVA